MNSPPLRTKGMYARYKALISLMVRVRSPGFGPIAIREILTQQRIVAGSRAPANGSPESPAQPARCAAGPADRKAWGHLTPDRDDPGAYHPALPWNMSRRPGRGECVP